MARTIADILKARVASAGNDPLAGILSQNEASREKLAALGVQDPTQEKRGPNAFQRLFGAMDTLGTGVRGGVFNLITPGTSRDVNVFEEMGKALRGEDRIEGADILEELGVDNKWGKLLGGFVVDILLDPITYASFGVGGATKRTGQSILGKLATTGSLGVDDLARELAEAGVRHSDDVARTVLGEFAERAPAALTKEASREIEQRLFRALGDMGGVKMFGQTLLPTQGAMAKAGYGAKDLFRAVPGSEFLERAFSHGELTDIYRQGNEVLNAGLDLAKRNLVGSMRLGEDAARAFEKQLVELIPDANLRRWVSVGIGRQIDSPEMVKRLTGVFDELSALRNAGEVDGAAVRRLLDDAHAIRVQFIDTDAIARTLRDAGFSDDMVRQGLEAANAFKSRMDDLYEMQKAAGVDVRRLIGDDDAFGSIGYLPGVKAQTDESVDFLRNLGVDPADIKEGRPSLKEWASRQAPNTKSKKYLTPEARVRGQSMDDMLDGLVTGKPKSTEFDLAILGGKAQEKAGSNIAFQRYQDDIAGLVKGLDVDEAALAKTLLERTEAAFTSDEAFKSFLSTFDRVLNFWKRSATIYRPGFVPRNFVSNKFMQFERDLISEVGERKAWKIVRGMMDGSIDIHADDLDDLAKIAREAMEDGVLTTYRETTEQLGVGLTKQSKPAQFAGGINEAVENQARLAAYITAREVKNVPRKAAAQLVDDALLNYDRRMLTAFERNIVRRLVPFYSWARRRTPRALETLMKDPGKFAPVAHLIESGEAVSDFDADIMPDWLSDIQPIPTPLTMDGNQVFFPTAGVLPIAEVTDILDLFDGGVTKVPENVFRESVSRLSPLLKLPLELAFNKDIYFQNDITEYPGDTRRAPQYVEWADDAISSIPLISDVWGIFKDEFGIYEAEQDGEPYLAIPSGAVKALNDISPWLKSVARMVDTDDPRQMTELIKAIFGTTAVPFETEKFEQQAAYDDRQMLQDALLGASDRGLEQEQQGVTIQQLLGSR